MKTRTEVIHMVQAKIRIKHFALSTEDCYCHWVGRYYDFCRLRTDRETSEAKAEAFLTSLARRFVSAKTQNQAFSALLFLYKEVLLKPLGNIDAMRAKRPAHERVAPSREQVRVFRAALLDTPNTPAHLLVDLLYGCGLRVCEPLDLRVQDVLWSEGQLVIRGAKQGKDRRVPIPACVAAPLRRQFDTARLVWETDQKMFPKVGVPLPHRLAYKYPKAATSWEWFWVFPAPGHCRDPLTQQNVRFRLLADSLQRVVHDASVKAGFGHLISPHVLRHAYATHSREPIERLRQLMGHSSIETTAGYRHAAVEGASNPLDDLLAETGTASPGQFLTKETAGHEVGPAAPPEANPSSGNPQAEQGDGEWQRVRWKGRPLFRVPEKTVATT